MDDLAEWNPLLKEHPRRGLRGYILCGEKDSSIPKGNIHKLVEKLKHAGIACRLDILPDLGHDYDPGYEPAILNALEYLVS
jgi:pimeloyl-ACP methyl ester carboxylesterase